jgi:hypothetical protein
VVIAVSGSTACANGRGYTVGATLPDGGLLPDGGALPFNVAYVNDAFPDSNLDATTDAGSAILYNIDPSLTNGTIVVTLSNPNVPPRCLAPDWPVADTTGLVPVSESSFSEAVVPTP